ncbi:MAG: methionyl-tRNA formyltransferase [Bacteroidales bacterium]|nr:methionyl-tRNA formyltransferase [Bacteroidales bacterium]
MKKLDLFILKSFIGPFFALLFIVLFILMMQFLWLYIDELVGKGLSIGVIMEFMAWGGATLLPLSMPLATLLASVMTMGQLSENNELIAMKSAGISLKRVMAPLAIASAVISVGAFFAANDLVPTAYNNIYTLRDDIGRTKAEIKIPTGTFYDGLEGYTLRVDSRNKKTGMMYNVQVYDQSSGKGDVSMTLADSAMMTMSAAKDLLTFKLYSGINYQETNTLRYRDTTLELQRISFDEQTLIIPLENYAFEKSDGAKFSDQVRAMNISRLSAGRDSLQRIHDSTVNNLRVNFWQKRNLKYMRQLDTSNHFHANADMDYSNMGWGKDYSREKMAYDNAAYAATEMATTMQNADDEMGYTSKILRHTNVELLKKFAMALACFILFFIGAPLGSFVTKKTGLGAAAIVAVLFFVLYWVIDITGTKLAKDGAASAMTGAFISTIILLPLGLFLSWKAVNDAKLFGSNDSLAASWRKIKSKVMRIFKKTRIVYMGTPEFAVAPLKALIGAKYKVVGVVTVADKPSGRGLKMNESAVKKFAVEQGIPVLQPLKLKDPEFLEQLAALKADLFVVVAFRMLPEVVWKMPPLGTFNLHAALLPQYRGAAPINWAVINGEKITGATTFMIDENIDTGGIMLRQECRISENETAGDIHDKLMPIGADLVVQTVEGIIQKNIETRVQRSFIQGSEVLKPAPKLTKELCHIDWDAPATQVYNLIRGLSPYPTAYTEVFKEGTEPLQLKVFGAEKTTVQALAERLPEMPSSVEPGTVLTDGKKFFAVATADGGAISLTDVQLSGKKRMDIKAFLAGFREASAYKTTKGTSRSEIEKTQAK